MHVIRCFEDDNIVHVAGGVDPLFDKEVIDEELQLKDLESIDKKILKGMQIKLAPENEYEDVVNEYKNIKRFMLESSGISLSENAGDIKMNLCDKCDKNKK